MSQTFRKRIFAAVVLSTVGCTTNDQDDRGRSTTPLTTTPAQAQPAQVQGSTTGVIGVAKFSPMDLQTNTGDTPILIQLGGAQDLANQVAANAMLQANALGSTIRTTIGTKTDIRPGASPTQTDVEVHPATALASGTWHLLTLSSPPPSLRIPVGATVQRADGTVVVRFRTDSFPIVRRVRFCDKESGTMRVLVDFSEPLAKPAVLQTLFTLDQAGAICGDVSGSLDGSDLMSTYMIDCTGFSKDSPAVLKQAAPLVTKGGKPLSSLDGGPLVFSLNVANLPIDTEGDGCAHHAPVGL